MNDLAIDKDFRLGILLVELELVTKRKVEQAAILSSLTTLPLGKLLSLLDYVPEKLIRSTIEAQSMLRDRLIKLELAKEAIALVKRKDLSFQEALVSLGFDQPGSKRSRLGELLTDANKIPSKQVDFGLKISDSSGLPLGQVFILMNKITDDLLRVTLSLQRELRSGHIDRDRVIARISKTTKSDETVNTLPAANTTRTKLGEIFLFSGIIDEEKINHALETAKASNLLLGEYLVQEKLITDALLGLALRLQSLIWQEKLTVSKAAEILKEASYHLDNEGMESLDQTSISEMGDRALSLYSFFRLSGYLSEELLNQYVEKLESMPRLNASVLKYAGITNEAMNCNKHEVMKLALRDPGALRSILNELNPADRQIVDAGCVFHKLVKDEKMSLQEALFNFSLKRSGA